MCVIKILSQHLKVSEKWILQEFEKASQTAYTTSYIKEAGTTSRVLLEFCKQKNISLLGYNQNENLFVKHTQDKNGSKKYRAIVFYMFMNHFYIINDEATVRHLTQSAKEGLCISGFSVREEVETTPKVFNYHYNLSLKEVLKLGENDIVFYGCHEEADTRGPRQQYYEQIQPEILTDMLKEYVKKTNDIPKIKMETRDRIKSLTLRNGTKLVLEATLMDRIPVTDLMVLCEKNQILFTNQSFSTFILQLKDKFSNHKRMTFTSECKLKLLDLQKNKCTLCDKALNDKTPCHIDHIRPLSNGGSNDPSNLQVLCISCHIDKTREEHSSLEHMRNDETNSCFNIQTTQLMNSRHFVKNAFTHTLPKQQIPNKWKLFSTDINKCRRNNLIYSAYDYCKYSVLDSIVPFQSSDEIADGLYYIETDNYFPMQGNKFYTKPMVEYCLTSEIITKNQIIYKFIPSNTIKVQYFKDLIDYMMNALDDEEGIMDSNFIKKLGPNCLIGCLGRRINTYFADPKVCYRKKVDEIGMFYQQSANPYIKNLDEEIALLSSKDEVQKLETSFPIFMQVLDLEAIELHKLSKLIQREGGIPVAVKTDAVMYYAPSKVNISNYCWDDEKTIKKYKHETASLPKHEINNMCTLKLTLESNEFQTVYEDNDDFNIIAKQIIDSEKGCLVLGPAGTGKTTLVNKLVSIINNDEQVKRLAPTNVSALLIHGETLDKFAYRYLNKSRKSKQYRKLKYIFVDEISMVKEVFYQILLSMKYFNPELKFILCGDFAQLGPVNDSVDDIYEHSRALYELVDGCKLQLTKCRRSYDVLFNICQDVTHNKSIDIARFETRKLTYLNVCYTNATRKELNEVCMNHYLKEQKPSKVVQIKKLEYDDNSQDYTLAVGMPLIARKTSSSANVVNNEIFKVEKIMSDKIILSNDLKDEVEIPMDRINKLFHLAFAMTIHKSQGATFNKSYTIHEWNRLDKRLKYVGLSRSSDIGLINICKK